MLLGLLVGLLLAGVIAVVALGPLVLAHQDTGALSSFYSTTAVQLAAQRGAGQSLPGATPRNLVPGREGRLPDAGRNAYTGSCAQCHGPMGDGKGALRPATVPSATDLTSADVRRKTDAQLFWIVKNGLSFSGMPAYGDAYQESDIVALVQYVRALQNGQAGPVEVPTPTADQLAPADPSGDAAKRGTAVYFAQGCHQCHGPIGDAPGDLALQDISSTDEAVRRGRPGMPAYGPNILSDAQLKDLIAYLGSVPSGGEEQG